MLIRSVRLRNYTVHKDTTLALPTVGAVVIQGTNGSGKSSFCEGVADALWGQTLRGTSLWAPGVPGRLDVKTEGFRVLRKCSKGGTKKLQWCTSADSDLRLFDTQAKAKETLAESLPLSFDLWRRTHVFSSSDAAHFSLATDHERKRLVEAVLDLTRFDTGLFACREDRAAADLAMQQASQRFALASVAFRRAEEAVEAGVLRVPLPPEFEAPPTPRVLTADAQELPTLRAQLAKAQEEVELRLAGVQPRHVPRHDLDRCSQDHQRRQARVDLVRAGKCPTCAGVFVADELASAEKFEAQTKAALDSEREKHNAAAHTENCRCADEQASLGMARKEVTKLSGRVDAAARLLAGREHDVAARVQMDALIARVTKAYEVELEKHVGELEHLRDAVGIADDDLLDAEGALRAATERFKMLKAVEVVLGMKGVRAAILRDALAAVSTVANGWLGLMATPIQIQLTGHSATKAGGLSERIGLELTGAAAGHGYKGASAGERRRVDAALLLALAEVASAATGVAGGTLWLDEVFDGLDVETGVPALGMAIGEIAQYRPVVLFTHSAALAAAIPDAKRYQLTAPGVMQ